MGSLVSSISFREVTYPLPVVTCDTPDKLALDPGTSTSDCLTGPALVVTLTASASSTHTRNAAMTSEQRTNRRVEDIRSSLRVYPACTPLRAVLPSSTEWQGVNQKAEVKRPERVHT